MTQVRSLAAISLIASLSATAAHASTVLTDWTFESTAPVTAGPIAADVGTGTALGHHASTSTYSSPSGNGSAHSFSSNAWSKDDYYQFSLSTLGSSGVSLSWDQTSSSTGPKDFELEYSTDGSSFTNSTALSPLVNGTPNTAWTSSAYNGAYTFTNST
jgi:hypothetical protein